MTFFVTEHLLLVFQSWGLRFAFLPKLSPEFLCPFLHWTTSHVCSCLSDLSICGVSLVSLVTCLNFICDAWDPEALSSLTCSLMLCQFSLNLDNVDLAVPVPGCSSVGGGPWGLMWQEPAQPQNKPFGGSFASGHSVWSFNTDSSVCWSYYENQTCFLSGYFKWQADHWWTKQT